MVKKVSAHSESNSSKSKSGAELADVITKKLISLEESGSIEGFESEVNSSHKDFSYKKQFLANFLIKTFDGKVIVVRSSTSFRSDRVKTSFYDLDGINNHAEFSKDIIASVFLVSDSELDDNPTFVSTRERILSKEYYCPATHLLTLSEFVEFLEGYNYNYLNHDEVDEGLPSIDLHNYFTIEESRQSEFATAAEEGSFYGKRGNKLEKDLVEYLSEIQNLTSLKNNDLPTDNFYKIIVSKVIRNRKLNIDQVIKIEATNSVVLLRSGGNAKTDIVLTVHTIVGDSFNESISVKNSSQNYVSCHDYKAEDFIRVMKCKGSKLADYFSLFQNFPTYSKFEENLPKGFSQEEFKELLIGAWPMFGEWVLSGEHDYDNLIDPDKQVSRYLFILNPKEKLSSFYSMEEYLGLIFKEKPDKFGVPFRWTYPSKQRTKRIQLKMPIIHR